MKVKKTIKKNQLTGSCNVYTVVESEEVVVRDIAGQIQKKVGIPEIRTNAVLYAVAETLTQHLTKGNKVVIDDLGTFRASVTDGKDGPEIKILFRPSQRLSKAMENVVIEEI